MFLGSQFAVALAREIDVHPQTVLNWINSGARPRQEVLLRVSELTHILLDEMLEAAGYLVTDSS